MNLRIIPLEQHDAAMNMAIDEALLACIGKGDAPPTLRFYTWHPPAISLGYFQSLTEEVDLEACKKENIDMVRRVTGGGAVFHDQELTYSIILPQQVLQKDILPSYALLCGALVKTFQEKKLDAQFVPINDIIVNNKKISGNAQTRRNGCILQHGTILLDVDIDKMFSLLKVPDEKMKGKLIQHIKERVTSMQQQLQRKVQPEELIPSLCKHFSDALHIPFQEGTYSEEEWNRALFLKKTKYLNNTWNAMR
ncbi:lipoate--protein ligase family protein [Candidatus Woesearchaeota archaeon]|nr:lipoate--protein ligase family protein [Candidatus Woesearchaeota archaeon]